MKGLGQAEKLLQSLGVTSPDEIDIEAIAWTMGAKVRNGILESCEARIIGFRNQAIITVKGDGDPRRRRFSIAHELGHYAACRIMPHGLSERLFSADQL